VLQVEADSRSFNDVARALESEADGAHLRRDLAENLRTAAAPAVGQVRSNLMGRAGGGLPHAGEPLRSAIAAGVKADAHIGGHSAGVSIVALKRGLPRNFPNAPKRFNARAFRHRVYGRDVWVRQVGAPGWFDDTLQHGQDRYRVAVRRALEDVAERIARRA
jgi:hypothetical protein